MRTSLMRIKGSEQDASAELEPTGSVRRKWLARARSWRFAGVTLVLLCLAVYVPGLWTLPPVDRDESRFAQASRQMFESVALPAQARDPKMHAGGLAIPMIQDRPRLNKPPLIYWLQAGSAAVLTGGEPLADAVWMYRVPSLLAAIASVLITWRLGVMMFDPRAAWLAGALLAICPIVVWESRQARADMVLLATTTAAMAALYEVWNGRGRRRPLLAPIALWMAVGAGVMTKGPITPMVVVLTAIAASLVGRRWNWLTRTRPLLGLVAIAACVTPWVIAVANQIGFDEYWRIVQRETIGRSAEAQEGHWGPPGYHLVLLCVLFWPGTLVTALAVRRAIALVRRARAGGVQHRPELFLLAWILPSWLVFELVSTKLPHYTLPLYPAIALLSARGVFSAASGRLAGVNDLLTRVGFAIWLVIGAALALGAGAAVVTPYRHSPGIAVPIAAAIVGVIGIALVGTARALRRRDFVLTQTRAGSLAAFVGVCIVGVALPRIADLWISPRILDAVSPEIAAGRPLAAVEFQEDSLIFATRGTIERLDAGRVPAWIREHPAGVVVAPATLFGGEDLKFLRSLGALSPKEPRRVTGFNYSQGKRVELEFGVLDDRVNPPSSSNPSTPGPRP